MTCSSHQLIIILSVIGEQLSLGKRIRKTRRILGISQQELAKGVGVTPQHISLIEQGKGDPSLSSLAKLAEELGVTIDYLVTGKESIITDVIPAIKGSKRLNVKVKKILVGLIQELYETEGQE